MQPSSKILIIRHGEKPGVPIAANGIDIDGNDDPNSLTAAGWQRAHALVNLFHPTSGAPRAGLTMPNHVFAAANTGGDHSKRSIETVTPLAQSFNPRLTIDQSIDATDITGIVEASTSAGGAVLVCWKHQHILAIAQKLAPSALIRNKWPGNRFDMVWVFVLDTTGEYNFSQVPELLLQEDESNLIIVN